MPAGGKDETAIEVQGKEEEPVDLDSSLIWAIRYLECETVESMLSEGKRLTLYHRGPAWVDPHAASDSGLRAPVRWFIRGGAPCRPASRFALPIAGRTSPGMCLRLALPSLSSIRLCCCPIISA